MSATTSTLPGPGNASLPNLPDTEREMKKRMPESSFFLDYHLLPTQGSSSDSNHLFSVSYLVPNLDGEIEPYQCSELPTALHACRGFIGVGQSFGSVLLYAENSIDKNGGLQESPFSLVRRIHGDHHAAITSVHLSLSRSVMELEEGGDSRAMTEGGSSGSIEPQIMGDESVLWVCIGDASGNIYIRRFLVYTCSVSNGRVELADLDEGQCWMYCPGLRASPVSARTSIEVGSLPRPLGSANSPAVASRRTDPFHEHTSSLSSSSFVTSSWAEEGNNVERFTKSEGGVSALALCPSFLNFSSAGKGEWETRLLLAVLDQQRVLGLTVKYSTISHQKSCEREGSAEMVSRLSTSLPVSALEAATSTTIQVARQAASAYSFWFSSSDVIVLYDASKEKTVGGRNNIITQLCLAPAPVEHLDVKPFCVAWVSASGVTLFDIKGRKTIALIPSCSLSSMPTSSPVRVSSGSKAGFLPSPFGNAIKGFSSSTYGLTSLQWEALDRLLICHDAQWLQVVELMSEKMETCESSVTVETSQPPRSPSPSIARSSLGWLPNALTGDAPSRASPKPSALKVSIHERMKWKGAKGEYIAAVAPYGAERYLIVTLRTATETESQREAGKESAEAVGPSTGSDSEPVDSADTFGYVLEPLVAQKVCIYIICQKDLVPLYKAELPALLAFTSSRGVALSPLRFAGVSLDCREAVGITDVLLRGGDLSLEVTAPDIHEYEAAMGVAKEELLELEKGFPCSSTSFLLQIHHTILIMSSPGVLEKMQYLLSYLAPGRDEEPLSSEISVAEKSQVAAIYAWFARASIAFCLGWNERDYFSARPSLRELTLRSLSAMVDSLEALESNTSICSSILWSAVTRYIKAFVETIDAGPSEEWIRWIKTFEKHLQVWRLVDVLPVLGISEDALDESKAGRSLGVPQIGYQYVLLKCLDAHPSYFRRGIARLGHLVDVEWLKCAMLSAIEKQHKKVESCKSSNVPKKEEEEAAIIYRDLVDAYCELLLRQGNSTEVLELLMFNRGSTLIFDYLSSCVPMSILFPEEKSSYPSYIRVLHALQPTSSLLSWLLESTAVGAESAHNMEVDAEVIVEALNQQDPDLLWKYIKALACSEEAEERVKGGCALEEIASRVVALNPMQYFHLAMMFGEEDDVLWFIRGFENTLEKYLKVMYPLLWKPVVLGKDYTVPRFVEASAHVLSMMGREVEGLVQLLYYCGSVQMGLSFIQNLLPLRCRSSEHINSSSSEVQGEVCSPLSPYSFTTQAFMSEIQGIGRSLETEEDREHRRVVLFRHLADWCVDVNKFEDAVQRWIPAMKEVATPPTLKGVTVYLSSSAAETASSVGGKFGTSASAVLATTKEHEAYYTSVLHCPSFLSMPTTREDGEVVFFLLPTWHLNVLLQSLGNDCFSDCSSTSTALHSKMSKKNYSSSRKDGKAFLLNAASQHTALPEAHYLVGLLKAYNTESCNPCKKPSLREASSDAMDATKVVDITGLEVMMAQLGRHMTALAKYLSFEEKIAGAAADILGDDVKRAYDVFQKKGSAGVRVDPTSTTCPKCLLPLCVEKVEVVIFTCGHCFHAECVQKCTAFESFGQLMARREETREWWGEVCQVGPVVFPLTSPVANFEGGSEGLIPRCSVCAKKKFQIV